MSDEPLYLARRGDCGGSAPNPAHCLADGQLLHATMEVLRRPLNRTTVFLAGGFGFGGHAMRAAGGDAAPWAPADAVATYLLWGSARRVGWLYDADARTYDTAAYYRDVVLSPPPFHSATWAPAPSLPLSGRRVCAARRTWTIESKRGQPRTTAPTFVLVLRLAPDAAGS